MYLAYKKKNTENNAKWWAAAWTFLTFTFHFILVLLAIELLLDYKVRLYPAWIDDLSYGIRKYTLLPFYFIIFIFFGRYFNKRMTLIEKKYKGVDMLTWKNIVLVALIFIGSFALPIILTPPR